METPSRILRRIEALEAQDSDLPSLPSFPEFEDSNVQSFQASSIHSVSPKTLRLEHDEDATPYQSTPAPLSSQTTRSTVRPPSSTSSATRFAHSMRASLGTARRSQEDSFEVSEILPTQIGNDDSSSASISNIHSRPEGKNTENMLDLQGRGSKGTMNAAAVLSYNDSNFPHFFVSDERTRTPSLSRTTPSPTLTSSNSTPRSIHSALPRALSSLEPSRGDHQDLDVVGVHDPLGINQEEHVDSQNIREAQHPIEHEEEGDALDSSQDGSQDSLPEPTISSEEHVQISSESDRARTPFPNAFSSPTQPSNTTPISYYPPHVKPAVADATATPTSDPSGIVEDLETPYNRRRSFLLSLVHSTTRPRMAFPTPHPHTRALPPPRPRAHPLSQAWTPSPIHLEVNSRSNPSSGSSHSPHDRLSFISTASSHDLTVHPRANASFDPTTGAKGVGRFNAVKLNTYLHGLNRRLQEENEMLASRLRLHGEEVEMGKMADQLERDGFKGVEEAVLEEVATMRDELDKYELEKGVIETETNAMVDSLRKERDEVIRELDTEREAREKDKERWKNRMAEVEQGIEGVIKELERRLEEAEHDANGKTAAEEKARELEARYVAIEDDLSVAQRRAEKAERALATSSDLGAEVKLAHEQVAAHEGEVRRLTELAGQFERRLRDAEYKERQLQASLDDQLAELDAELRQSLEAQQSAEAHALELEDELKAVSKQLEETERELSISRREVSQLTTENGDIKDRFEKQAVDVARNERESLVADHDALQRRYVEASAQVNRLRKELSASQSSHGGCRHQLDLRLNEIEDLRREVSEQARELERIELERNQTRADRSGIVHSVTSLESDLRRVITDAEVLGKDLKDLKIERDKSETRHRDELDKVDRAQKQLSAQLRLANEQLELQREKTKRAIAEWDNHVCQSNGHGVDELRTQHKNECKGLMVQIHYLKAKFTRESVFRADLSYQKHYLLSILSMLENSEKQIQAVIAHIGFPLCTNPPPQKRRRLRTVAVVMLFIARARRASEVWREQSLSKTAVQAALQDVRRRRIGGSLGDT